MERWYLEYKKYTYNKYPNTCRSSPCGHYTQVLNMLPCGMKFSRDLIFANFADFQTTREIRSRKNKVQIGENVPAKRKKSAIRAGKAGRGKRRIRTSRKVEQGSREITKTCSFSGYGFEMIMYRVDAIQPECME